MRIVCVYKSGGDYDIRYVVALKNGLLKYCPIDFEFYCLTDVPEEVEPYAKVITLQHDLPGWWSKIELFNPKLFSDQETVLYFDLDVLILKDITKLISACGIDRTFPIMLRSIDKVGIVNDWPSSSIMSWNGKKMHRIWYEFFRIGKDKVMEDAKKETSRAGQRTDQGFIRKIIPTNKFQGVLPDNYFVFKYEYFRNPELFDEATILNWTGRPRFHTLGAEYLEIRLCWRERCKLVDTQKRYEYEQY